MLLKNKLETGRKGPDRIPWKIGEPGIDEYRGDDLDLQAARQSVVFAFWIIRVGDDSYAEWEI